MIPIVPDAMQRVIVIGTTGSGKTTLARELAQILGGAHIELDAHNFLPGWTDRPLEDMRARIAEAVMAERWVACGNYGKVRDIVWPRADTAVWLNYPLARVLWRLTRRSIVRAVTRENLWNTGNRENFFRHLRWNRGSLYYWAVTSRKRHAVLYEALFSSEPYNRIRLARLTSVAATRAWLDEARAQYIRHLPQPSG